MAEKRTGQEPVPSNIDQYLNEFQMARLKSIERFGRHLKYLRRPFFLEATAIVTDDKENKLAVLEHDGELNLAPAVTIRNQPTHLVLLTGHGYRKPIQNGSELRKLWFLSTDTKPPDNAPHRYADAQELR